VPFPLPFGNGTSYYYLDLTIMLDRTELNLALESVPWLEELSPEYIQMLENIAHLSTVDSQKYLFQEGDAEDYLYILIDGQVEIEMRVPEQEKIKVHTADPFDIVGWSSVTPVIRQRTASALASKSCKFIAIDAAKLRELCEANHDIGFIILCHIANIVATRLLVTRLQMLDILSKTKA
jgi:CRP-like cAMP-binding protein